MKRSDRTLRPVDDRIRILHVIDHYRVGGPGKTIINTAKYIDRRKFVVHIGLFFSERSTSSEFLDRIKEEGVPHLLLTDRRGISWSNLIKFQRYIKKEGIRIIHTHGYKTDIHGVILKILLRNIYLITTHHGWIANTLSQKIFMRIDLLATLFFDGITVVAKPLLSMIPCLTKKTRKCMVIHNGLVVTDYVPSNHRQCIRRKWLVADNEIVFGVFGRLSLEKGCFEMLVAFKQLQNEIDGVKLVYVGEGPLAGMMREKINYLNLTKKVLIAGYYQHIQPLYEAIDVLVCPSKTEGLSNVILEALAFQKPVVATKVGGNNEIITDGHDGLLVDPGDTHALKNAMISLVKNHELRSRLGLKGHTTLLNRFDFKKRIKLEENFYLSILK